MSTQWVQVSSCHVEEANFAGVRTFLLQLMLALIVHLDLDPVGAIIVRYPFFSCTWPS
jgi:hypothetical protein